MSNPGVDVALMISSELSSPADADILFDTIILEVNDSTVYFDFSNVKYISIPFMKQYARRRKEFLDKKRAIHHVNVPSAYLETFDDEIQRAFDIDIDAELSLIGSQASDDLSDAIRCYKAKQYAKAGFLAYESAKKIIRDYVARHDLIVGSKSELSADPLGHLLSLMTKWTEHTILAKQRKGEGKLLIAGNSLTRAVKDVENMYRSLFNVPDDLWRLSLQLPAQENSDLKEEMKVLKDSIGKAINLMLHYGPFNPERFKELPRDKKDEIINKCSKLGLDKQLLTSIIYNKIIAIEQPEIIGLKFGLSIVKNWETIQKIGRGTIKIHPTERKLMMAMLPFKYLEAITMLSPYRNIKRYGSVNVYDQRHVNEVYEAQHPMIDLWISEVQKMLIEFEEISKDGAFLR